MQEAQRETLPWGRLDRPLGVPNRRDGLGAPALPDRPLGVPDAAQSAEDPEFPLMVTVFSIVAPPTGTEITGDGSSLTDEEMAQEKEARQAFLDAVSSHLAALPAQLPEHSGDVSKVELLGGGVWSQLNQYLLLVTGDDDPRIEFDSFMPPGTTVTRVAGDLIPLSKWPDGDLT
ncbi:hypothetical protein ACIA8I_32510 [Streptomyces rishiriensis]|uniref:hypothetical protein n=1 Tax=Streptomyces rishiriensis TaxID=68264 RepID=UPI0037A80270